MTKRSFMTITLAGALLATSNAWATEQLGAQYDEFATLDNHGFPTASLVTPITAHKASTGCIGSGDYTADNERQFDGLMSSTGAFKKPSTFNQEQTGRE